MEQNSLIDRLLELTLAIQHAAALADWQEAARLTEERTPLFMELTPEQDATAMEVIKRIQAIDAAIATDAKTTQSELQIEYSSAMKKVQAASNMVSLLLRMTSSSWSRCEARVFSIASTPCLRPIAGISSGRSSGSSAAF